MGVGGSAPRPGSLYPRKRPLTHFKEAGWGQFRSGQVRKISPPPRFEPRTFQPLASRYTDWATGPTYIICEYDLKFEASQQIFLEYQRVIWNATKEIQRSKISEFSWRNSATVNKTIRQSQTLNLYRSSIWGRWQKVQQRTNV